MQKNVKIAEDDVCITKTNFSLEESLLIFFKIVTIMSGSEHIHVYVGVLVLLIIKVVIL